MFVRKRNIKKANPNKYVATKNKIEVFCPTSSVMITMLLIKAKKRSDDINSSFGMGSDKNSAFVM